MAKVYLFIESSYEMFEKMTPYKHYMKIAFDSKESARDYMNRLMNVRERSVIEEGGKILSRYFDGEDDGYIIYDDMIGAKGLRKHEYHYEIKEESE